jgi:sugar phosphate isomerase/epimerase
MALEGPEVAEILDLADRTGTKHLGVVPDLGIFGFKPSEVQLAWFQRRGAQATACDAAESLAIALRGDNPPFDLVDMTRHTAGNLRAEYTRFRNTGVANPEFADAFHGVVAYADERVENPQDIDYTVVAEALMLSNTSADTLRDIAGQVTHIHGKFNHMSEIPGEPGHYQEASIDYPAVIKALRDGGFDGYINTEYEGQRYFQDMEREFLQSEVEQVRRHQEMLRRLLAA